MHRDVLVIAVIGCPMGAIPALTRALLSEPTAVELCVDTDRVDPHRPIDFDVREFPILVSPMEHRETHEVPVTVTVAESWTYHKIGRPEVALVSPMYREIPYGLAH